MLPVPGGREAAWTAPGTKRQNRLRVRVADALLGQAKPGTPIPDAVAFLVKIVSGAEPASPETRTRAAYALLRAGVSMATSGPKVDARQAHVHLEVKGIDREAYQGLL